VSCQFWYDTEALLPAFYEQNDDPAYTPSLRIMLPRIDLAWIDARIPSQFVNRNDAFRQAVRLLRNIEGASRPEGARDGV
jgi:hypothetical protein